MKIFKFGGASVKDSVGVRNILNVLKNTGFKNTFIVVSAMGKTTNALEQVVRCYFEDKNQLQDFKNKIENNSLDVVLEGIDEEYFKYIIQIVVQTNTQNGPFSAAPSSIKGNIYCVNNSELKPFGYFKVSEYDSFRLENIVID